MVKRSAVKLAAQFALAVALVAALLAYFGFDKFYNIAANANPGYLLMALGVYAVINFLFTLRIMRVLSRLGFRVRLRKTLMAHYGGMLAGDLTPAKAGYLSVPTMLKEQGVPLPAGFSCILGIQSVEFFVKVLGGAAALLFLLSQFQLPSSLLLLATVGTALMFFGGITLALASWFDRADFVLRRLQNSRLLGRLAPAVVEKVREYRHETRNIKGALPEVLMFTLASWALKGAEWYLIALALGITEISWLGFFLIHPLVTALGFVPLTPAGVGFQEGAIVGALFLMGIDLPTALAFAILTRVLLVLEDLVGAPQIAKTSVSIFVSPRRGS